ncbi:TIGR04086 family membrane protein [Fictibacillus fluitans]|uniref:TIGR04086 family membrane protein n=1 Tax=Fictibacillus fluitans TaxID=3058422 RepID=A0ABT8HZT5_9BACL|nr:TIGR04086 family membrane protein [Fictibacillus sp. NE201]MDN4526261.1 TIGR04086 family membrane protein [Fictibacillus sp. NE201]
MNARHMFSAMIKGVAAILVAIIISSLILSLLLRFTSFTELSLKWVTTGLSFLSLFIGGFLSGKKGKEKGMMLGIGTALLFSLFVFLVQYLGYQTTFTSTQYLYHGIFLLLCMLGSIMGVNVSSHK